MAENDETKRQPYAEIEWVWGKFELQLARDLSNAAAQILDFLITVCRR